MIHMNMIIRTIIIMSIFMIFRIMSWLLLVAGTRQHGDGLSKIRPWICNLLLFFFLHSDVSCRQRGVMGWEHDGGWYVYAWWRYWLIHDGWDMVVDMSLSLCLYMLRVIIYFFFELLVHSTLPAILRCKCNHPGVRRICSSFLILSRMVHVLYILLYIMLGLIYSESLPTILPVFISLSLYHHILFCWAWIHINQHE